MSLPRKESDFLFPRLTLVNLELHDLLQEAGHSIEHCYFPNTAMDSILNIMQDGKSVEVELADKEGYVGFPLIAGFSSSSSRVVTQARGTAFRIDADYMRRALRTCPQLNLSLLRYSQEAPTEVTQIAACNRLHEVDERLARWLLMSHHRIGSNALPLTQDFLAQMLGTRRAGVSVGASILHRAGLIEHRGGHVSIINRAGLEQACCECYGVIQRQLEHWRKDSASCGSVPTD